MFLVTVTTLENFADTKDWSYEIESGTYGSAVDYVLTKHFDLARVLSVDVVRGF